LISKNTKKELGNMLDIKTLFDPIGIDLFLSDYFEKKPLLIKRNAPSFYNELISLKEIDDVLFSQKINAPGFRLVNSKTDTFPDTSTFCHKGTTIINPLKFVQGYAEGHTLAMAGFQNQHIKTRNFCFDLENLFGHPFQTNFYLTPSESKGFSPHWDSHDVIVLQISGNKIWKFYENSVELADANLKFEKDGFEAGKVIQEITLEQGDLLYIPRGLTHDAYTAESHSLHVTTGFLGYTWSQYLIESIVHLSKQDSNFRKFIPLGAIYSSDEQYKESLKLLLAQITKELESKTGLNRFESALKEKQYNCCSNLLMEVMNLNNIDSNTLFSKRNKTEAYLEVKEEIVCIIFNDTLLEFPLYCEPSIAFILKTNISFKIDTIPGELDNDGKLVLVKKLVKEGLLTTEI
jgi:ribosomal protein L16 Arg81 hydroxylase